MYRSLVYVDGWDKPDHTTAHTGGF